MGRSTGLAPNHAKFGPGDRGFQTPPVPAKSGGQGVLRISRGCVRARDVDGQLFLAIADGREQHLVDARSLRSPLSRKRPSRASQLSSGTVPQTSNRRCVRLGRRCEPARSDGDDRRVALVTYDVEKAQVPATARARADSSRLLTVYPTRRHDRLPIGPCRSGGGAGTAGEGLLQAMALSQFGVARPAHGAGPARRLALARSGP